MDLAQSSIEEDVGSSPAGAHCLLVSEDGTSPGQRSPDRRSPKSISPVPARRIIHPNKLEKKLSSSDLHSRLKTRKLLGVGETDDGDVHRSKLSQILGHSEQLYIRLPRGLVLWQLLVAIFFSVLALWALLFPRSLYFYALQREADDTTALPIRLYGAALIGYVLIFWNTMGSSDRDVIRWTLLSSSTYLLLQTIVAGMTLFHYGIFMERAVRVLGHHFLFGAISVYYYLAVDQHHGKMRRSGSSRDVSNLDKSPTVEGKKEQ